MVHQEIYGEVFMLKKVGIIQSNYIPWRGYFDFINSVDLFIFHDDLQYTKRDWRNRNQVKVQSGTKWLSVPVHYTHTSQLISDVTIDYSSNWCKYHQCVFSEFYRKSPYLSDSLHFFKLIADRHFETISDLNTFLIQEIMSYLDIHTPVMFSSELDPIGSKTERLIDVLQKVDADVYVSGPSASAYLDLDLFRESNIGLEYKTYDYDPYPQLWGDFIGTVSVLDLIANCGPESKNFIHSHTRNNVVVSRGE